MAWVDMRLNLAASMVIAIAGVGVAVWTSRRGGNARISDTWMIVATLVASPVLACGFGAVDVFLLNPDIYPTAFQGDSLATLSRVLVIGTLVGIVASVVLMLASNARRRNARDFRGG